MNSPRVTCVMLHANRPEMARHAVESFRAQTYDAARRELLIYDTGYSRWFFDGSDAENEALCPATGDAGKTIGELRNAANTCTIAGNVIIHWDSDDWSHPNRVAEQVALLQSSGADVVGYNEMLFWRSPKQLTNADVYGAEDCERNRIEQRAGCDLIPGEAWLYSEPNPGYALGTSLCYWRRTWERKPFEDTSRGEDEKFCRGLNVVGQSAMREPGLATAVDLADPRMIARIHPGNTSRGYDLADMRAANPPWTRVPEWDWLATEKM